MYEDQSRRGAQWRKARGGVKMHIIWKVSHKGGRTVSSLSGATIRGGLETSIGR